MSQDITTLLALLTVLTIGYLCSRFIVWVVLRPSRDDALLTERLTLNE